MKCELSRIIEFRDESPYRRAMITQVTEYDVWLTWQDDESVEKIEKTTVESMIDSKRAVFLTDDKEHFELSISDLPEKTQKAVRFRYECLKAIAAAGIEYVTGRAKTIAVISSVSADHTVTSPHWQTVRQWHERFIDSGYMVESLVPRSRFQGNRAPRFPQVVVDYMHQAAEQVRGKVKKSIMTGYSLLVTAITLHNRRLAAHASFDQQPIGEAPLQIPTYQTFNRFLKRRPFEVNQRARFGARSYVNGARGPKTAVVAHHVLEFVELDATELDIYVLTGENDMVAARPWLTIAIDRHTDMAVGFHLSFHKPSYTTLGATLANSFVDKDDQCAALDVSNEWPAHGLPQTLVVDNGREFWSTALEYAMAELHINVQYCPIRTPQFKGSIERFFRTITTTVLEPLPGFVPKPGTAHHKYKAWKEAKLTFDEFQRLLCQWIFDVHHCSVKQNAISTPLELWFNSIVKRPVREVTANHAHKALLPSSSRKLSSKGIRISYLDYNSDLLKSLYGRDGERYVRIRWNPLDITYIYVQDLKNLTYIRVPCMDRKYASGITWNQHKRIYSLRNKLRKEKNETLELQDAKLRFFETAAAANQRPRVAGVEADLSAARAFEKQKQLFAYRNAEPDNRLHSSSLGVDEEGLEDDVWALE